MINPYIINTFTGIDVINSKMRKQLKLLSIDQFIIEDVREESHTRIINRGVTKKFTKIHVEDN